MIELPPFVLFYIGALLAAVSRGYLRSLIMLAIPVVGLTLLWDTPAGSYATLEVMGFTLEFFEVDRLSLLFGYLFHIAALIAIVYSLHVRDTLQQSCSLLYAGSALGAVFAGDFLTLFIFWEMLALTSVFLIWARRSERAYARRHALFRDSHHLGPAAARRGDYLRLRRG